MPGNDQPLGCRTDHVATRKRIWIAIAAVTFGLCTACAVLAFRKYQALSALHRSGFMTQSISGAFDSKLRFLFFNRQGAWRDRIEHSGWMPGLHAVVLVDRDPRRIAP